MVGVIVSKYGGSSVAAEGSLEQIARITTDDPARRVIVVSAPGKRPGYDEKVTDMLIRLAKEPVPGSQHIIITDVMDRYHQLSASPLLPELEQELCRRVDDGSPSRHDAIVAYGEYAAARLIAHALGYRFVDSADILMLQSNGNRGGKMKIAPGSVALVQDALKDGITVVPGFYVRDCAGATALLPRGGSDLTGSYIAAALKAAFYENFTDVNGVFAANPSIVSNPHLIREMTYDEIGALSYSGFKVLHSEAITPLEESLVRAHIRSTAAYPSTGTKVFVDRICDPDKPIVGVSYRNTFYSLTINAPGLNHERGIFTDVTDVLRQHGVSLEHTPTGIDDFSMIFSQNDLKSSETLHDITSSINKLLTNDYGLSGVNISTDHHHGSLVVAGRGIKDRPSVNPAAYNVLLNAGVDVLYTSMGMEKRCIIFGIRDDQSATAVNAVYDAFLR